MKILKYCDFILQHVAIQHIVSFFFKSLLVLVLLSFFTAEIT